MGSMEEPVEEYESPFNFEQGVNTSYLYLSPKENFTPPGSPVTSVKGNRVCSAAERVCLGVDWSLSLGKGHVT